MQKITKEILNKADLMSPIIITKDFDWTTLEHEFVESSKPAYGMLGGKKTKYYEKTYKSRLMVYEMKYMEDEVFEDDDLYKISDTHFDYRQSYGRIIVLMDQHNYELCREIRKCVEQRFKNLEIFTLENGIYHFIIIKK